MGVSGEDRVASRWVLHTRLALAGHVYFQDMNKVAAILLMFPVKGSTVQPLEADPRARPPSNLPRSGLWLPWPLLPLLDLA